QHQVLEHLRVVAIDDLGIDLDRDQLLFAVGLDRDHATAGRGIDLLLANLLLHREHLLLQLLCFLHHVAEALHWPSPSGRRGRTATTSPWKISFAAFTAGWPLGPASPSLCIAMSTRSAPATWRRTSCVSSSLLAA